MFSGFIGRESMRKQRTRLHTKKINKWLFDYKSILNDSGVEISVCIAVHDTYKLAGQISF